MRTILLLLAAITIAGCGYKGPLYLPDKKSPATRPGPVVVPEPAPDRPVPSEAAPSPK